MNHIRAIVHAPSGPQRLLLTLATAFLLLAGLLAMHTLTGTLTLGHPDTSAAASESAAHGTESAMASAVAPVVALGAVAGMASDVSAAHCSGDCGVAGGAPDHSMLTMVCILALLAAAIVLLAPVLLARLGAALALLRLQGRTVLAALPQPRPPSLIVLSVSRT